MFKDNSSKIIWFQLTTIKIVWWIAEIAKWYFQKRQTAFIRWKWDIRDSVRYLWKLIEMIASSFAMLEAKNTTNWKRTNHPEFIFSSCEPNGRSRSSGFICVNISTKSMRLCGIVSVSFVSTVSGIRRLLHRYELCRRVRLCSCSYRCAPYAACYLRSCE